MVKMNLLFKAGLMSVVAGMYSTSVFADAADGSADATLVAAVTVTESTAMNFGNIIPDGALSGDVVLDTADGRTIDNGTLVGGTVASGAFQITGSTGSTVTIVIADGADLTGPDVDLVFVPNGTSSLGLTHVIDAAAANNIASVGGTLTVPAAHGAGTYTSVAAYTVTVNYQ